MKQHSRYFPHDYHARHDPKLIKLKKIMGYEGVGIYWCLIEIMYEQGGYIKLKDLEMYAETLTCDLGNLQNIIKHFSLFFVKYSNIYSHSVNKRIESIKNRSEKARQSANYRWEEKNDKEPCERIANATDEVCERNAINKSKVNKIKEKEIKEITPLQIPPHLLESWTPFLEMRKSLKKPAGQRAQELLLKKLESLSTDPDTQIKIINQSVMNSWQGFFELKGKSYGKREGKYCESDGEDKYAKIGKAIRND